MISVTFCNVHDDTSVVVDCADTPRVGDSVQVEDKLWNVCHVRWVWKQAGMLEPEVLIR